MSEIYKPWNLYDDGINSHGLEQFLDCREQFRLNRIECLESRGVTGGRLFGSIMHNVLEEANIAKYTDRERVIKHALNVYEKENEHHYEKEWEHDEFVIALNKAEKTATRYLEYHRSQDKLRSIKGLEEEFSVSITFKHPLEKKKIKVSLVGTYDQIFTPPNESKIWIQDRKTFSNASSSMMEELIPINLQFLFYAVAYSECFGYDKLGGICVSTIRNSQLRKKKDENNKDFSLRISEDIDKRPDYYFIRYNFPFKKNEVKEWKEKQLIPMLQMLVMWYENKLPHFYTPRALNQFMTKSDYYYQIIDGKDEKLQYGKCHWMKYRKD